MKKTDKMTAREAVLLEGMVTMLEFKAGKHSDESDWMLKYYLNILNELDETLVFMRVQTRKFYEQEYDRNKLLNEVRRTKNELEEMIEKNRINDEEEKICAEMF